VTRVILRRPFPSKIPLEKVRGATPGDKSRGPRLARQLSRGLNEKTALVRSVTPLAIRTHARHVGRVGRRRDPVVGLPARRRAPSPERRSIFNPTNAPVNVTPISTTRSRADDHEAVETIPPRAQKSYDKSSGRSSGRRSTLRPSAHPLPRRRARSSSRRPSTNYNACGNGSVSGQWLPGSTQAPRSRPEPSSSSPRRGWATGYRSNSSSRTRALPMRSYLPAAAGRHLIKETSIGPLPRTIHPDRRLSRRGSRARTRSRARPLAGVQRATSLSLLRLRHHNASGDPFRSS